MVLGKCRFCQALDARWDHAVETDSHMAVGKHPFTQLRCMACLNFSHVQVVLTVN